MNLPPDSLPVRLDKWLWAARFYKTRALAAEAVTGGKVQVDGARVKPSRLVVVGSELRIRRQEQELIVLVQGLSKQRRPASEAVLLYAETEASRMAREQKAQQLRDQPQPVYAPQFRGRPSKKARRQLDDFVKKQQD